MNNWFSRFFTKTSAVAKSVYLITWGSPQWMKANYSSYAKEGYGGNVTVYACINEIATAFASIPIKLVSTKGKEIIEHPMMDLLKRPNPFQGQVTFMKAVASYLLISGNSYIERVGPKTGPSMELWTLRPDRIAIKPHPIEKVSHYEHNAGGLKTDIPRELVLHLKTFSATDDYYGLSPLSAAAMATDVDIEALKWTKGLMDNAAAPSGFLKAKGELSPNQREKLKKEIEDKFAGSANSGRPMLLEGDLDWTALSWSPEQSGLLDIRRMSKLEICQAYQVPPELIGDQEHKTYNNYAEARKSFYVETIIPLAEFYVDELNRWLAPTFGADIALTVWKDGIDAIHEDRLALWDRLKGTEWLTINEKRKLSNLPPISGGDVILISVAMIPLGTVMLEGDREPSRSEVTA